MDAVIYKFELEFNEKGWCQVAIPPGFGPNGYAEILRVECVKDNVRVNVSTGQVTQYEGTVLWAVCKARSPAESIDLSAHPAIHIRTFVAACTGQTIIGYERWKYHGTFFRSQLVYHLFEKLWERSK